MTSLSLILITHNSAHFLPNFFTTWQATSTKEIPILLADSGSTDQTLQLAKSLPTQLLSLPNLGFAAAANRAIAQSTADWILLCNPDLTFPQNFAPTLLQLLATAAPTTAIIAPKLLNPDSTPQPSVGRFPTLTSLLRDQLRPRPHRKYQHPQPTTPTKIHWATGACLAIRRTTFNQIGGFDEKYFLYVEELDLQKRLHDAGHQIRFEPSLTLTHLNPNALRPAQKQIQLYAARGMLRYFAKFANGPTLTTYRKLAILSRRLPLKEALAPRKKILQSPTGP